MRKRMTIMVGVVALMVALFTTAAYAASTAVYGTKGDDPVINESSGFEDDRIYALAGDDYINAVVVWSTTINDADKLFGGQGTTSSAPMTATVRICSTAVQVTMSAMAHLVTASLTAT
jgi:hypothetical protein